MDKQLLRAYCDLRIKDRLTPAEARKSLHIHFREAASYEKELLRLRDVAIERGGAVYLPEDKRGHEEEDPLSPLEYSNEALEALEDFAVFRDRYLGRDHSPWQVYAAEALNEYLGTIYKEFVVVNCPPGSGKSTLFAHDIPLWMVCRNRALRTLIGSYTERQAVQYIGRIRRTLQRKTPLPNAHATLLHDYGGFRPLQRDLWRVNEFIVAQVGESDYAEKEPSFAAFGYDSAFLGGRFDLIVWDDLVDKHVLRTSSALEAMEGWFGDEAETRAEPGGLFILQGQRMAPGDLYRHALNLKLEDGGPKYHHICFKAHYEDQCEKDHGTEATPWPVGCLLDPKRVPWRDLASKMRNAFGRFQTLYQQEDIDSERALVQQRWLDGDDDHPGCWDKNRKAGEWPTGAEYLVPVATIDPSAVNNWGCILWAIDPSTEFRYVIDVYNGPLQVSDFLDYSFQNGDFHGLIERWWQKCYQEAGHLQSVIVEVNAAQRWLAQARMSQQWSSLRGTQFVPHQTGILKNDPDYGVQALAPLFQYGKVRLPGRGENEGVNDFVQQLLQWPDTGKYNDLVMSAWFLEAQWNNISWGHRNTPRLWTPSWMKETTRGLDYVK